MFFYAVFFIIILACITKIVMIVVQKFPNLTIIDTEAIPAEREAKRKKELMQERLARKTGELGKQVDAKVKVHVDRFRELFRVQYRKVLEAERQLRKDRFMTPVERRERTAMVLIEAATLAKDGRAVEAEKKFIDAIALSPRDAESYRGLGVLYLRIKRYEQAKETLAYLLKLLVKENRCIHTSGRRSFMTEENPRACPASNAAHADLAGRALDLAAACEGMSDRHAATEAYERAVAVEPSNPRHLDLLLDACILEGDRARAEEVFAQLEKVNPENMKLPTFAERIEFLPKAEVKTRKKTATK